MKHLAITLSTAIILVTAILSCGESITEPNYPPGRRDYVWTVDTIKIPFNFLSRLWGSQPTDIWATGLGGGLDQTIWHFDGTMWKTDGVSRSISPTALYGLSANNLWIGGMEGKIWHYDGIQFKEILKYQPTQDWIHSRFYGFHATTSKDIYATGSLGYGKSQFGIIFHFNGFVWTFTNVMSPGNAFMQIKKGANDANYYLWSWRFDDMNSDSVRIYSFNGEKLMELYRGLMNDSHDAGLEVINGKVYCGRDNTVYTIEKNRFVKKFDVNNSQFIQGLNGRNEKDIFLWMWDGVAHYNGVDVEYIYKTPMRMPRDLIVFENQIVILFNDWANGLSLIVKGKLK